MDPSSMIFEYDAPTFVDFISTKLEENDGADNYFDKHVAGDSVIVCVPPAISQENPTYQEMECQSIANPAAVVDMTINKSKQPEEELSEALKCMEVSSELSIHPRKTRFEAVKRRGSPLLGNRPSKFISMAECMQKFQFKTPDRFHTRPRKDHLKPLKHVNLPSTIPQSPALQSHLRVRKMDYLTREQEEEKELQEIHSHQVKAHPLNPNIFKSPKFGTRIPKQVTVVEPFNLTEVKKVTKTHEKEPLFKFTANPVPRGILKPVLAVPEKNLSKPKVPSSPYLMAKKHIAQVIERKENGVVHFKDKEIAHFGVPTSSEHKKPTDIKPFSFEERDKLMQKRKEEKIRTVFEQEKKAREFHANPLPQFIKSRGHELPSLYNSCSSYQSCNSSHLKKEQENEPVKFKARPAKVLHQEPFKPLKPERSLMEITHLELNTERRAKERAEFENRKLQYEAEIEKQRRQKDEELRKQEEEEIARLRKEAEHKANPIRRYKPLRIVSADQPLTDARSPLFSNLSVKKQI